MRPGKRERREFEHIRHGTQTLIASFDVAQGRVVEAGVGDTRTEADYLSQLQQWIATDPKATTCVSLYSEALLLAQSN